MTQSSRPSLQFAVLQLGPRMRVTVRIGGRDVATFDIDATDFKCFIDALDRRPVVTVTHCDPTTAFNYIYQHNLD